MSEKHCKRHLKTNKNTLDSDYSKSPHKDKNSYKANSKK